MSKSLDSLSTSSPMISGHLSLRKRWDHRYATCSPQAWLESTPFVISCLPKLPICGRALDIAAGAGRHTIVLAGQGLRVDAVDISWQGLRLARQRAFELRQQIHFIVADVERTWLPHRDYNVILVSFFLYRPLFPLIKDRLLPGGWLIYETFIAKPGIQPGNQPVRREYMLEPGELKNAFENLNMEILFYDEGNQGHQATAQLLARKPLLKRNWELKS